MYFGFVVALSNKHGKVTNHWFCIYKLSMSITMIFFIYNAIGSYYLSKYYKYINGESSIMY